MTSDEFADWLSLLAGEQLFIDNTFHGGGLHAGGSGSYLDMHTDFERHPNEPSFFRRLNILLYLNQNWIPSFKGHLKLRHRLSGQETSIEPLFNRLVVMSTDSNSIHGYDPIDFPSDSMRLSIAAYAYSTQSPTDSSAVRTTTRWYSDNSTYRSFLSNYAHHIVSIKQRLFGSSTSSSANN